jgi:diguanylate cyclase (GGDEF)-like protein
VNEQLDTLQHSRLFQNVPHALAASVLATSSTRSLAPGDTLLHQGQPNDVLYVVLSGRLGVLLGGPAGPRHVLVGPGDVVGELSVIDGNPVSADVIADEPTTVLGIEGDELWAVLDASPEMARNLLYVLSGRVRHDTTVLSEAARLRLHFERAATVDGLTGLRNRRWLDEAFSRQLTRTLRHAQTASLLMIDVDGFKSINDTHGHLIGDAVLCRVARVLAERLRPQDLLARYAGDEFLLMLPECDIDEATALADRLRTAVAASADEPGHDPLPRTTVSIGVATARLSDSLPALIGLADSALYRAKHAGRNRISR